MKIKKFFLVILIIVFILFLLFYKGIKTKLVVMCSKTPSRTSLSIEESKKHKTYLWEYQISNKNICYTDSIRNIQLKINSAFAEKSWFLSASKSNGISFKEHSSVIVIPCTYYYKETGFQITWKFSPPIGSPHLKFLKFIYQDKSVPPDTLDAYIVAINKDNHMQPLPGDGDTLVSFSLYRKY